MLLSSKNKLLRPPVSGILCMIGGALALTINDGMAKYLTETYPVGQVMALRGTFILCLLIFLFISARKKLNLKIYSWRNNFYRAAAMTGESVTDSRQYICPMRTEAGRGGTYRVQQCHL